MESLVVQFTVYDNRVLDDQCRILLWDTGVFRPLPATQAQQAWGEVVPSQAVFIARIEESAVFITRDWEVTIRSRRLMDCVGIMCTLINALHQEFGAAIDVRLIDPHDRGNRSLERQMDWEKAKRRYKAIGLWFFTVIVSGFAGAWIQQTFWGG